MKHWLTAGFFRVKPPKQDRSGEGAKRRSKHHPAGVYANGVKVEVPADRAGAENFAQKDEEDLVNDYNAPIHMWVVATLFPLIAGTFGPMASMFNICAIAIDWRLIVKKTSGPHIPDPHWLVPVNIVSLVIAILANASLLGQMTNRLRYNISGPITIVGFYISGLVDIALVGAASTFVPLPPDPQATYSQAFYYAAFSGAIYLILAMLLSVTAWGIWFRNYATQFKLSLSQRSLMLQTVFFLSYTLIAAEIYSVIEGWQYLDGVYFVVVTLFTIGFGDLVPRTHLGRSLFFPFAVGGILFVGVIIGNIRTVVLESGSVKVSTRLVEKARFQAIQAGNPEEETVKLRGLKTRTTKATTELKRREKEFEIMREIQSHAATNNKLVSLAFSTAAFMILWFIGAVAFWKAESTSVGGQNWSYFESLYFTYVAQLTIGYGDFEPQTNSAKPTFVFWALIALPTLTVLIGAIGDVVAAFTNWYTAWLGKNAQNLYSILEAVWQPHNKVMDNVRRVRKENSEKSEEDSGLRDIADISKREAVPQIFATNAVTSIAPELAEDMYRPFVMLKAAHTVMGHLDETPPRKYTYEEWTWLLSLIGEDEADHRGHRRVAVPLPDGLEVQAPMNEKHQVWSWLGQESPLLSLEDDSEPKWVLKRIMLALEKSMKAKADEQLEKHMREDTDDPRRDETM